VFVEGFLQSRDGFVVHLPTVPLGRLYGEELRTWLADHDVEVRLNAGVKALLGNREAISAARLRDGSTINADWYILAVSFERVLDLLPESAVADPYFAGIRNLAPSPITSVHLWFDRPVMPLPHAVIVDGLGQWAFNRGEPSSGEFYLQVVISAARAIEKLDRGDLQNRILEELGRLFPAVRQAKLLRGKMVTERTATFSAVPGVDRWRPTQESPIRNLMLAGDWTATGWPATMESAVRSGERAAEAIESRIPRLAASRRRARIIVHPGR
jgi:squalene-associated FAD-dependent desaturase